MLFHPTSILATWLRGLLALVIPILAIVCFSLWYNELRVAERAVVVRIEEEPPGEVVTTKRQERTSETPRRPQGTEYPFRSHFRPGWNTGTAALAGMIGLLIWALHGRRVGRTIHIMRLRSTRRRSAASSGNSGRAVRMPRRAKVIGPKWLSGRGPIDDEEPQPEPPRLLRTGRVQKIERPDGSILRVETYGSDDAPPMVFVHGWGATSDEWYYQKVHLAERFRLIVWDLPGLGFSRQPDNGDFSMEKLAADLEAVLSVAGGRPAVLVGHSIGVMILLTFCRLFREDMGTRVAGLALVHGSYKDPIQTVKNAALFEALRIPVIIPLLRLTIWIWPVVALMNRLSYANGTLNRQTRSQSFAGPGTREQEDFLAHFMATARPDVMARGMFGMMAFDETATLPMITVPTLVVIGDKDVTTLPEAGEFMARKIPGAVAVTLSPARHLGLFEYHDQFNQILADFTTACQVSARPVVTTVVTT